MGGGWKKNPPSRGNSGIGEKKATVVVDDVVDAGKKNGLSTFTHFSNLSRLTFNTRAHTHTHTTFGSYLSRLLN